jgi:rhamnose utilization protein RhaD (predicted bifunctional aldolase and dehydrogenase)
MAMNTVGIEELIKISHYAAANIGYIQGGGGNTSVKLDDQLMAVKASGCKLSQMGQLEGYVVVDYKNLREYFAHADIENPEFDRESGQQLQLSIRVQEGLKELRPSVEAGFHSVLKKYVIHTHSVYANLLCCSQEGKGLAETLFATMNYLWLPYVDPGAKLTLMISKAIADHGSVPDVIFMENHGVIVTAEDSDAAIALHEEVNTRVREYFKLSVEFEKVMLEDVLSDDGSTKYLKSASPYVTAFFDNNAKDLVFIREKVLYPDQLVYLNNSIYKKDGSVSDILFVDGTIAYTTSRKQAEVNEETLVAYLFVIQTIEENQLTLVSMTYEQQAFILGWESEAYRKSMLK